ncbi:hypothetical protein WMY93_010312 [Mugilogobius chulae]|uniref:LINE-1 type transposase domain-containing 1 n=1 Tax=Mugilogobius chulae TaxID=88201 RepID=A0AAW0P764_9GOBI
MTTRARTEQQKKEDVISEPAVAMLKAMLEDHRSSLSAEINASITRLESKLDKIQSAINDHDQRLSSLEDAATDTRKDMHDMEVKLAAVMDDNAKLKAKLVDLESRSRRNNIRIVGVPEDVEGPRPTAFFSEMLLEVFGKDILKTAPDLDRAHRALAAKPGPAAKPRAVVVCFHNFQTRELVVRKARELRGKLRYKDSPLHIFEDYCPEVLEQRSAYRGVMKELYNLGLKPALRFPGKIVYCDQRG